MQAAALQKLLEGLNMGGVDTTPRVVPETTQEVVQPPAPTLSAEKETLHTNQRDEAIR